MILTNKFNLPKAFELAVGNDPYDKGSSDVTVTQLISPPRIRVLFEQHRDEVTEDVSDRLWALLGTAVHKVLEQAGEGAGDAVEERLYTKMHGWTIGGKFDSLRAESGKLSDFKVTSVWTRVFGSRMKEWTEQLNLLAHLCRVNGRGPISELSIVAFYRDWQESKAGDNKYPSSAVEEIPVECWTPDEAAFLMDVLVRKHQDAEKNLPLCTDEDRWLDHRSGKFRRCERYCPVASWCEQFREEPSRDK